MTSNMLQEIIETVKVESGDYPPSGFPDFDLGFSEGLCWALHMVEMLHEEMAQPPAGAGH